MWVDLIVVVAFKVILFGFVRLHAWVGLFMYGSLFTCLVYVCILCYIVLVAYVLEGVIISMIKLLLGFGVVNARFAYLVGLGIVRFVCGVGDFGVFFRLVVFSFA